MAETMNGLKRTSYCGRLSKANVGKEEIVCGWVQKQRDKGHLIFIDLRDRTGVVQLVFDDDTNREVFEKAALVHSEYVLIARGLVRQREAVNTEISTGEIEIHVEELRILSKAQTPPFEITDKSKVKEELRLKYRYLDLRRKPLQEKMILRHQIAKVTRDYFYENDFLEIETPMLIKSTPEGARDYLVPSRIHHGKFYALPQSPQIYKQLLMLSGFDRYIQLARCFRDEDLRADRQPEFTQVYLEMSFVTQEDIMDMLEGYMKRLYKEVKGIDIPKMPRLTYREAMERFGSDKPDTRFGLEICDITDIVADSSFGVFSSAAKNGGSIRLINATGFVKQPNPILSRKDIDALGEFVKTYKAKGLATINVKEDAVQSSIAKFLTEDEMKKILSRAKAQPGDLLLIVADKNETVFAALGALRLYLAEKAHLIDESKYDILWITEFPQFEYSEEEGRFVAMHHPFTMPKEEDLPLIDTNPAAVRAKAYDLVINGQETGGGSIRIHSKEVQNKMFEALGFTEERIQKMFGWFVTALNYGTPPHGGLAFGLDRLIMLLTKTDNIKDVIAFPKVQNASDLMTEAPSEVEDRQLKDLNILLGERK